MLLSPLSATSPGFVTEVTPSATVSAIGATTSTVLAAPSRAPSTTDH